MPEIAGSGVNYSRITDRMIIGGYITSQQDFNHMIGLGVTHFVCLLDWSEDHHDSDYDHDESIHVLCSGAPDDHCLKPESWHRQIVEFVLGALVAPTAVVYLHCAAGQSRSALAWYTVLRSLGHNVADAKHMILSARPQATLWPDYLLGAEHALHRLGYVPTVIIK
jgi:hypothetical protein